MRRALTLVTGVCAMALVVSACAGSTKPAASHPATTAATTSSLSPATSAPAATAQGTAAGSGSPGSCGAPHAAGQSSERFVFEGVPRTYQLYVPRRYGGTQRVPVVFEFHGYGSNAAQQVFYGDFRPLAERDGFLIVAPDGQGATPHFNLTGEPGLQDDIAMVNALLEHIEAVFCVDTQRVYATGMSDGGAMSSVLACRDADRFAAFAPVAVVVYPGCTAARPVAITAFSGTADPIVPFNGGQVQCCGGATVPAAPDSMAGWARFDGCAPAFVEERLGTEVRRRTWSGCRAGGTVVFYIIDGGGHTWPGAVPFGSLGLTTQQIKATDTIWDFFKARSLAP